MKRFDFSLMPAPGKIAAREPIAARTGGILFIAGAALVGLTLALPHPSAANEGGLAVVIACAALSGAALIVAAERVSAWLLQVACAAGAIAINASVYYSGAAGSLCSILFVWPALFASYFFIRRQLAAQLAWLLSTYAATLWLMQRSGMEIGAYSLFARWLVTGIVVVAVAVFVSYLVARRVDAERELEELRERAEHEARRDPLTGLPNRRYLAEELARVVARARRTGNDLTLVMLDLDRFKPFNDQHGHAAGDELLRTVAHRWSGVLREGDVVARLGGDEFVMLLPSCSLADTGPVLERLHDAMPEGQSCSAGACEWDRSSTASEFLQQADEALYAVKRGGRRNRVMQRVDAKHDPQRVSRD